MPLSQQLSLRSELPTPEATRRSGIVALRDIFFQALCQERDAGAAARGVLQTVHGQAPPACELATCRSSSRLPWWIQQCKVMTDSTIAA